MNKILFIIAVLLVPIAIFSNKDEDIKVYQATTLEKYNLELPIMMDQEETKEDDYQVLISQNTDKSEAYYLDLEDYIVGVVAGEMPASFNMEALKAQAVAARTYAVYKMQNIEGYVLATTTNDQVYLTDEAMHKKWGSDYDYYLARIKEAVDDTRGEVITYNDQVIIAHYFAISNGYTDDASVVFKENKEYLKSVDSSWDKQYKAYSSSRVMDKTTFCNKLDITCGDINIANVVRAENNYVRSITINNKTFTGREVFSKLSLKSTDFNFSVNNNEITITTYGFGHGVGLSQYGANGMASEGNNYQDILKHYYQNTEITKL